MDEWDETLIEAGYIYCRPHEEWHRPPECAIDQQGEPLMWCGCRWVDVEADVFLGHREGCSYRTPE